MRTVRHEVTEAENGRTVRSILRGPMAFSTRELDRLKGLFMIRLNGDVVRVNVKVKPGDVVSADLIEDEHQALQLDPTPLNIVYEDEDLMVIDKPAPLASQVSPNDDQHTLANRVAYYFRDQGNFVYRVVNRLDKGTSGLMIVAKNAYMHNLLRQQLHTEAFVRRYQAVVEGRMQGEGTIDLPIRRVQAATIRRSVDPEGKRAVTHYRVLKSGERASCVELTLETGRTHQIRVHLSHLGHPLVGDFLYGTEDDRIPRRFALHASFVALKHPVTGVWMTFESALPGELKALL